MRETTLKTSHVFSHFHVRLNFIGNMQLPDINPAISVSTIPIANEGVIYRPSVAFGILPVIMSVIMSREAPGSWGVL